MRESRQLRTVCVAGASGLVGSNIVMACLDKGWTVHGTLRDPADHGKTSYLMRLPGADHRLKLFPACMSDPGSFGEPTRGADCVFIACLVPTYYGPTGIPAIRPAFSISAGLTPSLSKARPSLT